MIHIVPENLVNEWNRNKGNNRDIITKFFNKLKEEDVSFFKHNSELYSTYQPDVISDIVQKRIDRIDVIINGYSEKALHSPEILLEAATRNLKTLAPSHKKDSFRDAVNIVTLFAYLKKMNYEKSYFTTLNYKDFSIDASKRFDLHNHLVKEFSEVNLSYIYFGEAESFGSVFFANFRKELPSFQEYLKAKKIEENEKELAEKKLVDEIKVSSLDAEYLNNIRYIDLVLASKNPTAVEQRIIKMLLAEHESYKRYFFNHIGNNGVV